MHRVLSLWSAVAELLVKLYYVFNSIQDSLYKQVSILLNTLVIVNNKQTFTYLLTTVVMVTCKEHGFSPAAAMASDSASRATPSVI